MDGCCCAADIHLKQDHFVQNRLSSGILRLSVFLDFGQHDMHAVPGLITGCRPQCSCDSVHSTICSASWLGGKMQHLSVSSSHASPCPSNAVCPISTHLNLKTVLQLILTCTADAHMVPSEIWTWSMALCRREWVKCWLILSV